MLTKSNNVDTGMIIYRNLNLCALTFPNEYAFGAEMRKIIMKISGARKICKI